MCEGRIWLGVVEDYVGNGLIIGSNEFLNKPALLSFCLGENLQRLGVINATFMNNSSFSNLLGFRFDGLSNPLSIAAKRLYLKAPMLQVDLFNNHSFPPVRFFCFFAIFHSQVFIRRFDLQNLLDRDFPAETVPRIDQKGA